MEKTNAVNEVKEMLANELSQEEIERTEMYACYCGLLVDLDLDKEMLDVCSKMFLEFQNTWYNKQKRAKVLEENQELVLGTQLALAILK